MISILMQILGFIAVQLVKALLTAQAVKDGTLYLLKELSTHTKAEWDDKVYKRVQFYFEQDKSEHIQLKSDSDQQENK